MRDDRPGMDGSRGATGPRFPAKYPSGPLPYQEEAYERWVGNGRQGVMAMATGTGKTVTALNCALREFERDGRYRLLVLVPTLALLAQWRAEMEAFGFGKCIEVSSHNPSWRRDVYRQVDLARRGKARDFAILSTYGSFTSGDFQGMIPALSEGMILIADEAHNIGGKGVKACFSRLGIRRRIGLTATPERVYDEGGGNVAELFNDRRPYTYSFPLSRAIREGMLCRYFYHPKVANLDGDEMADYASLTRMLAELWDPEREAFRNAEKARKYVLARKRIVHKCADKVRAYGDIIRDIGEEGMRYAFVYAPEGGFGPAPAPWEGLPGDGEDGASFIGRLLDTTKGIYPRLRCSTFTGRESRKTREGLLSAFAAGRIDVLFAMRCLDEGVDVPRAERGIITSSTGNPRQFIQRRGRLLRTHPDKAFSHIYDIIVAPPETGRESSGMERNLLMGEFRRVAHFASLAENLYGNDGAKQALDGLAKRYGIILDEMMEGLDR